MGKNINRYIYLSLAILCFLQIIEAQNKKPGGVSGAVLWLIPTPASSNLQGAYCWRNYINQGVNLYLQDDDVVKTQENLIWQVPREQMRHNNYHPLLPLGQDRLLKSISFKDISLNQMTSFAVFTTTANRNTLGKMLYQIDRHPNQFFAARSQIKYYTSNKSTTSEKSSLPLAPEMISKVEAQENLLYLLSHSVADRPSTSSVWGRDNAFKVFWAGARASSSSQNSTIIPSEFAQDLYCSEFIIYPRWLSPTERLRVESYLAIKYGAEINKSYLLGEQMLWEQDATYNYRISGFASIPSTGLSMQRSTIRQDGLPIWSNDGNLVREVDSFFEGDSYNGTSEASLISISREDASPLDSCYFLYGDNNGSLELIKPRASLDTYDYKGFRLMQRRWKASYCLPKGMDQPQDLWKGSLDIKSGDNHLYSFTLPTPLQSSSQGVVRTTIPLKTNQGYYSFTYAGGECKIGYEVDSELYAYQIDALGHIYIITKSIRGGDIGHILRIGDRVEILRENHRMYLRVNGRNVPTSHTTSLPIFRRKYLGFLEISSRLDNLRVGGFYDAGCKVELSSSLFPNISDSNLSRIYLVIDPEGRGQFNHKDLVFIPASSWDKERKQVIFNNVYWADNEQGQLHFSFGYRDSAFILYAKDVGCQLSLKIPASERGEALYRYKVKDLKRNEVIATGIMISNREALVPVHNSSEYEVNVEESTFLNADWKSFHLDSESPQTSGLISWTHRAGDYASVIFRDRDKQVMPAGIHFKMHNPGSGARGIQINQDDLVGIYNYPVYESRRKLSDGDQITITLSDDGVITYWVNNESIWGFPLSKSPQWGSDANFEVLFSRQSENKIKNLLIKGLQPWEARYLSSKDVQTLAGVLMQTYTTSIKERIQVNCDGLRSVQHPIKGNNPGSKDPIREDLASDSSPFRVYQESQLHRHRAVLSLQKEVMVDLLVFDMAGHLIYQAPMPHHGGEYTQSFEIHIPGVYIVKALTNETEYTQKIQVR